jgi:hypothetical protein
MRKALFTLDIDNYEPKVKDITFPLMSHWAHKIGAEFIPIRERKFPGWPVVYEKLQIHDLGRGYDWSIFMDADAMVYPETPDWTALMKKDTVAHYGFDWAPVRWSTDEYFLRDGRFIGSANWLAIASDWCLDLWRPLDDLTLEEAVARIHPTVPEGQRKLDPSHLIDDYTLSRNIARFGLKAVSVMEMAKSFGQSENWYWHRYDIPSEQKAEAMHIILSGGTRAECERVGITLGKDMDAHPGWHVPMNILEGEWGGRK